MYWQVYLHKTVLSAEYLLVNILKRAKEIAGKGEELFCTPSLRDFLYNQYNKKDFNQNPQLLDLFAELDDYDIYTAVKVWTKHKDIVLSKLCRNMVNRNLYRVELQNQPFRQGIMEAIRDKVKKKYKLDDTEAGYFVFSGDVANDAYRTDKIKINIVSKDGQINDIADAADHLNISALSKTVKKYFLCYPKDIPVI